MDDSSVWHGKIAQPKAQHAALKCVVQFSSVLSAALRLWAEFARSKEGEQMRQGEERQGPQSIAMRASDGIACVYD